jgi:pyridoxal biosynthesis lyase PdxS
MENLLEMCGISAAFAATFATCGVSWVFVGNGRFKQQKHQELGQTIIINHPAVITL